jgi:AcrR family transcriptional regulator
MIDPPRRLSLRDEQKALTRRRLLDSAEAVFAHSGFHGASVEEIAREAGATTGALYSNFAGKEDLFLALFEERIAADVGDYSQIVAAGATVEEQARGAADRWMAILRERPAYFPLLIEFWAYAIREPLLRERLAGRFAALRTASARLALEGAERQGYSPSAEAGELVGLLVNALGNGLALEKLTDPDAVPDWLFGDMLVLIFQAFQALGRTGGRREARQRWVRARRWVRTHCHLAVEHHPPSSPIPGCAGRPCRTFTP